jgi:hypothetical protein
MGYHQAQRVASTVPGCQPGQRTLWLSGETRAPGRTQEDDAMVFCQSPESSTSHLLAHATLLIVRDSGKPSGSRERSKINRKRDP